MRIVFRCDPALEGLLPKPVPARLALPDWLRAMARTADSEMHPAPVRTVKQCPPFVDAMSHGFVVPLPCDVTVRAGALSWDWDAPPPAAARHPRAPLSFHAAAQVEGAPFHDPARVIVKFNSFWTIALEPGWSLFAMHPANRADLPFRLLSGLVDCDRFTDVGLLFPAVWTDPSFDGVLARGTPVAQCFPVPRQAPELSYETFDPAAYDRLAESLASGPGVYRKRFRAPRSDPAGEVAAQIGGIEPEPPGAR
jgi:hypothetical protein